MSEEGETPHSIIRPDRLREPLRALLAAHTPHKSEFGTKSAVLLPLFERDGDTFLWLLRRPDTMRTHSGQVALPGGKRDEADASPVATALRETEEELGIGEGSIDVLGVLDDFPTITGFVISPVVGWVAEGTEILVNPREVARAFHTPLGEFLKKPTGIPPFGGFAVEGEWVWGATAAIMRNFAVFVRNALG